MIDRSLISHGTADTPELPLFHNHQIQIMKSSIYTSQMVKSSKNVGTGILSGTTWQLLSTKN